MNLNKLCSKFEVDKIRFQ